MKRNAVNALLKEYLKVISELQQLLNSVENDELTFLISKDYNLDCQSIQHIIRHVISAGYSYGVYILNHKGIEASRPIVELKNSISEFQIEIQKLISFTQMFFSELCDTEIEEIKVNNKILTSWGQTYDIEQLLEHAIVHVLRHRLQIENYLTKIRTE